MGNAAFLSIIANRQQFSADTPQTELYILCILIQSIPYIILMKNKTKVGEMSGPNKEKLKNLIAGALKWLQARNNRNDSTAKSSPLAIKIKIRDGQPMKKESFEKTMSDQN